MKISTRGRYAIRVMLDLAEHNTGEYIPLMDIAKRQEISEKYLESIVSVLSKQKFVKALRGKGGGYRLARTPSEYTIGSILRIQRDPWHRLPVWMIIRTSARELPPVRHFRCGRAFIS